MKDVVKGVEILKAFDVVRWFRDAARVAGCDHHTVIRLVELRDAGALSLERPVARSKMTDAVFEHIEAGMEQSRGRGARGRVSREVGGVGLHGFGAHESAGGGDRAPAVPAGSGAMCTGRD